MITILNPIIKSIQENISLQNYNKMKNYINSPYLIEVWDYNEKIIENILTGEIISISFPIEQKDEQFLITHWFKIEESINPYSIYKEIKNKVNKSQKNKNNYSLLETFESLVVFTTLGCNANCTYCYEKNERNNKIKMSKNVADKIISLIMKRKELEKVHFSWFGGEPLFNNEIISYICSELKKNNINYSSSMITNGLLFNKELILKAKDLWRLSHLQITLDGTEYEYEKIKQVPSGSFNKLLDNILFLLQQNIRVNIRLNLSQTNLKDLKKLVKILYEKFSQFSPKKFNIEVHELFGEEKEINTYKNLLNLQLYIESIFGEVFLPNYTWREHGCMGDTGKTITVLPDGNISVCEHNLTNNFITNLDKEFYDIDLLNEYAEIQDKEECQLCPIRPGCIYNNKCPSNGGVNCNINRIQYLIYIKKKKLSAFAKKQRKRRKHLMITKNLYKNLDIYNKATALIEAFNTQDGSNLNYPVKISFYLQKNMNAFVSAAREIEQKRSEIVKKFGVKNDNSEDYIIPDDKIEEASQELQDFFDLEQEIPVNMMKLSWFDNIDMNAAQVAAISFMIEEEE